MSCYGSVVLLRKTNKVNSIPDVARYVLPCPLRGQAGAAGTGNDHVRNVADGQENLTIAIGRSRAELAGHRCRSGNVRVGI